MENLQPPSAPKSKTRADLRIDPHTSYTDPRLGPPHLTRNAACRRCPLYAGTKTVCIATHHLKSSLPPAPSVPAVLALGQNPGAHEDELGFPFIGQSGYILHHDIIGGAHLDELASVYVGNVVRCLTPQNAKVPTGCTNSCFPYTLFDLEKILAVHTEKPVCLLLVGAPAAAAVFRLLFAAPFDIALEEAFTRNGQTLLAGIFNRHLTVFSTYHPAHFARNHNTLLEIHHHLGQLSAFLQGRAPVVTKAHRVAPFDPHTSSWPAILKELPPDPTPVPQPLIIPLPDDDIPF